MFGISANRKRVLVMIDIPRASSDLKGVLIKGQVEVVDGKEALKITI